MTIKAFSHWRLSSEQCFGKFDKKADFQLFFGTQYSQTFGNMVQMTGNFQRSYFLIVF